MYLRAPIVRIKIGNRFFFQTGDSYLQSAEVILSENERASSCSFSIYDPGLKVLNLLLLEFQQHGGIYIPANLLSDPSQSAVAGGGDGTSLSFASGAGAVAYIKDIEAKYGTSDLSGLTPRGKKASEALINENVRAFLNAIAIAELGDKDGAPGKGYGYLFGDTNGRETFDPRTLTSHPKRRRTASGFTSSATGRMQVMDFVWDEEQPRLGLKDFKPVSQEIIAVSRMMYRGILEDVMAGRFEQAIQGSGYGKGARYEWASLEGNPYGQGTSGGKRSTFLANIQRFLAASPKKASTTTTTATKAPSTAAASLVSASIAAGNFAPSLPFSLDTTPTQKELPFKPPANSVSTVEQSIVPAGQASTTQSKATDPKKEIVLDVKEGVLVYIETGFNDGISFIHEFFLTSVRGSNDVPHTTKIGGNQLRYVLARGAKLAGSAGKIYKIRENTTIRQVANEVTGKVGAKVGELSELADVIFEKSYQAESDYEYLLRLARESGLFLRSNGSNLDIKPLASTDRKITINAKVLMEGSRWGDSASDRRILSIPSATVVQRSQAEDDTERDATPADEGENQSVALTETAKKNPLTAAAGGILALTQSAATSEQIGRGFEGQLIINSVLLPVILEVQPGQIVDLDKDTGLGEALTRGYRIGEVRHKYSNNKIITTLDIYLPVKIKPPVRKVQVTDSAAPVAAGNIAIPANLQASPKTGDAIAQFTVSSPYGPRRPPKTATGYGTKIHQGVDVPMPIATSLYPICNPGETVTVTKSSGGAGGLVAEYKQGDWIFQYMHLSEVFTGVRKYGEPICKSGNSGNSSGPHLHFTQRKASDRSTVPPAAGYIFFAVTGRSPS